MLKHTVSAHHPLARTTRTHVLQIEFTTRCDLKCTYCAVSQPSWNGKDLDLTKFSYQGLIDSSARRNCRVLNLHGHGETTMLPDWVQHARKAVDSGAAVTICTNFAHTHTDEETDILARFHGITISIDTVDHKLYKRLRRGGDLRTLIDNMVKLRSVSEELGTSPKLTWCIVLSDQNWRGMPELVKRGLSLGVRTFTVCNLCILPTPKGGTELRHISTLPPEEAREARDLLLECRKLCDGRDAHLDLKAGLMDTLEAIL